MKPSTFLQRHQWCQGSFAQSKYGRNVDVQSSRAVKFCMLGAIIATAEDSTVREKNERRLHEFIPNVSAWNDKRGRYLIHVVRWNDMPGRTKAEVVTALKKVGL